MRILLAGAWRFEVYEQACACALRRLGHEVIEFGWGAYLTGITGRIEEKWLLPGPRLSRVNRGLLDSVTRRNPDLILVWRGTPIRRSTLQAIRRASNAALVSYNNDDPFSESVSRRRAFAALPLQTWRHYLDSVTEYDVNFVYRDVNVAELRDLGAKNVHVLKPYYVPSLHYSVPLSAAERQRFACDVVFAGHYEDDGRLEYLHALASAGLTLKVFGPPDWNRHLPFLRDYGHVQPLVGLEYAKAICASGMALCFLSALNRDTYTRRCYEIPACGTLLLSQRTEALADMFSPDREAVFFSNPPELVQKALWLKSHAAQAQAIAAAGYRRVHDGRHSVVDRMGELLEVVGSHLSQAS